MTQPSTVDDGAAAQLLSWKTVWARARHNAFTDLARFRGLWFCVFREARAHAGCQGRVRVLVSADGERWRSAARLAVRGLDLRDPKLSVRPDGSLLLLAGGTELPRRPAPRPQRSSVRGTPPVARRIAERAGTASTVPGARRPRVFLSRDGESWSAPRPILADGEWLWRVTWHQGRAWGVSYRLGDGEEWAVRLLVSDDGLAWETVCDLEVPGRPNETTVRFLPDGRMMALVRREGGDRRGWIGVSPPPFTSWEWRPAPCRFGGPNFLALPDGSLWAAGRDYREDGYRTALARLTPSSYEPVLELPGEGDCSYPGLVWHEGLLWVCWYASRGRKTEIRLGRVRPAACA